MSIELGLILTTAGLAEFAVAITEGRDVNITQMVLGDANGAWYEVTGAEAALLNEQWRGALLQITVDPGHANRIICDAPLPLDVGGFTIREFGLLSSTNVLMAIGMHQVIELPAPGESTTLDIVIRGLLDVVNAAVVNMVVDPYIVTATRAYVDDALTAHNIPATEAQVGHVQLATVAEALAGVIGTKAVHPEGLKAAITAAITAVVNGSPGALDTLKELADALGDDANFATTVVNALALKAPLASPALTGAPTAPTAVNGTNTTQIATTAFVQAALGGVAVQYVAASQGVNKGAYLVNTSAGPIILTLPLTPNLGDSLEFIDAAGTWSPNNLTINRNGQTIMGVADNLVCNVVGEAFRIWFDNTTWRFE